MASATFLSTLVFSAMASMICDFVNAIIFYSSSVPCQGRRTRKPHHYKNWRLGGKKNRTADQGLESGSKTTLCPPCFIGHKLQLTQTPEQKERAATLHAAKILHSAESRGKTITAGNVAYYAIEHTRSGRRSCGNSCVDAMAAGTQLHGHSRMESMEQVVASNEECGGEIWELHDVLASDEEDPATRAARKMDWDSVMASLSARDRAIINCLVEGKPLASLARRRHLNSSTILFHKRRLADAIQEFTGSDILIQIRRKPTWKDSLNASRERLACREVRRHL